MPEWEELRAALGAARAEATAAVDEEVLAKARLRRIEQRLAELGRSLDPQRAEDVAERKALERKRAAAAGRVEAAAAKRVETGQGLAGVVKEAEPFLDPTTAIEQLDDTIPILMIPVRLETRFGTSTSRGGSERPELWVRVYPDDCSVDAFEATLSESEVTDARLYWADLWAAGGIEDQERGAWRGLVAGHGSGRAAWIVQTYRPENSDAAPVKADAADVVLTIPTEVAPPAGEADAIKAYWAATWLADGAQAPAGEAYTALRDALGPDRAAAVVEEYVPSNLAVKPVAPLTKADVAVQAAFVVFPSSEDLDVKAQSWSRAPEAALLPERFVFVGYRSGAEPLVQVGNTVRAPLTVGPDPSLPPEDQLREEDGELIVPEPMRWMVEFDRAVDDGMGFRIRLDEATAGGFDRVLVVGLRLSSPPAEAAAELETLIDHHRHSRAGFRLLPQGTPTNNTDVASSGSSRVDDPDASFDLLTGGGAFTPATSSLDKTDGQWLAEYLGIDPALVATLPNAGLLDQADARAMNTALWPATLGYWMETMMSPVFGQDAVDGTRSFFTSHVSGRGAIPAIQVGRQSYGILPATAFSRMEWPVVSQRETARLAAVAPRGDAFLPLLYRILRAMDGDWREMSEDVSYVGKDGDPHQLLLDAVGLHPASVEFAQRYAESFQQMFNVLWFGGFGSLFHGLLLGAVIEGGMDTLRALGYPGEEHPDILERLFFGSYNRLDGPVVDEVPLSETTPLRVEASGDRNYIEWLIDAAGTSLQTLYAQQGFTSGSPPRALLYMLLRHALQLGYHDEGLRLRASAQLLDEVSVQAARREPPFLHVSTAAAASESRYAPLFAPAPEITGAAATTLADYITGNFHTLTGGGPLREQMAALERLKDASTARLERAFVEHVDCCTHRLDAWMLGLVHYQLALMRNLGDDQETEARRGIHVGAYVWLDEVRPQPRTLTPVQLPDDLVEDFDPDAGVPLLADSSNQGYVHAPSLDHAVAAAVLRNGYTVNAGSENAETMAVNLTSERVRVALGMLEGVREGQSLGALLGYQLERGLHDRHSLAEVDKFIYDLRKQFPLVADRMQSTSTQGAEPPVPIEALEARNVVDGLALVEHVAATGQSAYPFGKPLPGASAAERSAIDAEVARMLDAHDAVADLALAEGVYQAVLGNYDRVAATYDAYSRGNFPPEPEVVKTPGNGRGVTHRVGLHLDAAADPTVSPVGGVAMTPRATAEPALNQWLASVLPPLDEIACTVTFHDAGTNASDTAEVTLKDLGVQPADLLWLVGDAAEAEMTELDERIVRAVRATRAVRPDRPVTIAYMTAATAPVTLFEVMPLVRSLRRLTRGTRALRPSDLTTSGEATDDQDAGLAADKTRLVSARDVLQTLHGELTAFVTTLATPLADVDNHRDQLVADADAHARDVTALLERAARFGISQAGWGFVYDFIGRAFASVLETAAGVETAWTPRLTAFDALLAQHDALAGGATDEERFDLLQQAERQVSATTTQPLPSTPAAYRTAVVARRNTFEAKLNAFRALAATPRTRVSRLLDDAEALLPVDALVPGEVSFDAAREEIVTFLQSAVAVAGVVATEAGERLDAAQTAFDAHDTAAPGPARLTALEDAARAFFGEGFRIFPAFTLAADHGTEVENARAASASGDLLSYVRDTVGLDFPVDTWLYGVARVRERMRAWEQTLIASEGFDRGGLRLLPMQLPFVAGEKWLGLDLPPDQPFPAPERVLYTAHFSTPFAKDAPQCGLLVDEWSEVVPDDVTTTGITFHYDRPNSEPPQAMLLVTPTAWRGGWRWDDLVDALNETLELSQRRLVEPDDVAASKYAPFLPATVMATVAGQLTIAANLSLNNRVDLLLQRTDT